MKVIGLEDSYNQQTGQPEVDTDFDDFWWTVEVERRKGNLDGWYAADIGYVRVSDMKLVHEDDEDDGIGIRRAPSLISPPDNDHYSRVDISADFFGEGIDQFGFILQRSTTDLQLHYPPELGGGVLFTGNELEVPITFSRTMRLVLGGGASSATLKLVYRGGENDEIIDSLRYFQKLWMMTWQ